MDYCHYWDGVIQQRYQELTAQLPPISREEEVQIWKEILRDYPSPVLLRVYNEDVHDPNVNDRPRRLGAIVWKRIKDNTDLKNLFMSQMREMGDTNGYCPQGRTNRFIQVLFASLS